MSELKTMKELVRDAMERYEYFAKHNRLEDGVLIIDVNEGRNGTYEIELERISSPLRLLGWVRQLGEKTWMEKDRLIQITEWIAHLKGWTINT